MCVGVGWGGEWNPRTQSIAALHLAQILCISLEVLQKCKALHAISRAGRLPPAPSLQRRGEFVLAVLGWHSCLGWLRGAVGVGLCVTWG